LGRGEKCWTASGCSPSKVQRWVSSKPPVTRRLVPLVESLGFCRVLSPRGVASYRLNAPSSSLAPRRGSTLRSFAPRPFRKTQVNRKSSREVLRSFRVLPACAVTLARTLGQLLPWGSGSLQRRQCSESTNPGLTSPGPCRFQVFATSYRFAPPLTLRVCFTPLTLLGFTLQSFLLATSRAPYRSLAALLALPS